MYGYPLDLQLRLFIHHMVKDILGVEIDIFRNPNLSVPIICCLFVLCIVVPVCFLFRKERWFIDLTHSIKEWLIAGKDSVGEIEFSSFVALFTTIFVLGVSAKTTSMYIMGAYGVRYLFIVFPIFIIFLSSFLFYLFVLVLRNKRFRDGTYMVIVIICICLSLHNNSFTFYMIHEESGITLHNIETRANAIVLLSEHWMSSTIAPEMGNREGSFFVSSIKDIKDKDYTIDNEEPLYIIVDTTYADDIRNQLNEGYDDNSEAVTLNYGVPTQDEVISYFKDYFNTTDIVNVGYDAVFGRTFEIYKVM